MTDTAPHPATVTVSGHGTASATPDLVRVSISVETHADTVATAYNRAGARAAAVTEALRADGVRAEDISTSGLSVRADTVWKEEGGTRITGYVASTTLTVALRITDSGSDPATVVAHAVDAGGDDVRLGGLTLTVADQAGLLSQARDAAWDDALIKARRYAARAERGLGPVLEITEADAPSAPGNGVRFKAAIMEAAPSPIPLEYGETEISATIRATWTLDPEPSSS